MSFQDPNSPSGPQASRTKFIADQAASIAAQFTDGAALETIFNNILAAAGAGGYRLVVDLTTLPGIDLPTIVTRLQATLGYTVSIIGTDMTIAWDYVGVTGLPDKSRFPPYP